MPLRTRQRPSRLENPAVVSAVVALSIARKHIFVDLRGVQAGPGAGEGLGTGSRWDLHGAVD